MVTVPLPFVGEEDIAYAAWNAAPETGPLEAPISSTPFMLPFGLAPAAANSPEKAVTPNPTGLAANPAYVPFTAAFVRSPVACGSPKPERIEVSVLKRNASFEFTR